MSAPPFTFSFCSLGVRDLHPDPSQPRKKRSKQADKELLESMRQNGMCQTILVREEDGKYIIVNGERRWNAATELGWEKVDCLLTTADSKQILILHLIENVQREDLCPEDLASYMAALMSQYAAEEGSKATMRILSTLIGKSVGWVSEKLALAHLPADVQALKDSNTVKNSRVLIGLSRLNETNPEAATTLIKEIESGKTVSVDLINEVRGRQRKKRAEPRVEVRKSDLPSSILPVMDHETIAASDDAAPSAAVASSQPEPEKPRRRKKKVSEVARLIGVRDDLPAEDLLEALAEAYAKLFAEHEAVAA